MWYKDRRNREVGWRETAHGNLVFVVEAREDDVESPFITVPNPHWMFCKNEEPTSKTLSSTICHRQHSLSR